MDVKESIVSAGIEPILGHFDHFLLVELVAAAGGLHDKEENLSLCSTLCTVERLSCTSRWSSRKPSTLDKSTIIFGQNEAGKKSLLVGRQLALATRHAWR